jgi:hypothetical protein
MRKLLILSLAAAAMGFLAGCASAPPLHNNMTGDWTYTYGNDKKTGGMTIHQSDYALSGFATDAEGKFILTGSVSGDKVTLTGKKDINPDRTFTANLNFTDDKTFEGTYTNSKGDAGPMRGSRK